MELDVTGIRRSPKFSPNHIDDDWIILKLTASELSRQGCAVQIIGEDEVDAAPLDSPVIFNMCQGARANQILGKAKNKGGLIINQPDGVLNCHRHNLIPILQKAGIPFPQSFVIETANASIPEAVFAFDRLWIKRGDVHATGPGDVVLAEAKHEPIAAVLEGFRRRGITQAVLQEHLEGPTIKFYAVQNDGFFRWYPLQSQTTIHIDEQRLYQLAEASAEALSLQIYGGDAIATPDGQLLIIDINDWPSYARFRESAAIYIARHILKEAKENGKL